MNTFYQEIFDEDLKPYVWKKNPKPFKFKSKRRRLSEHITWEEKQRVNEFKARYKGKH